MASQTKPEVLRTLFGPHHRRVHSVQASYITAVKGSRKDCQALPGASFNDRDPKPQQITDIWHQAFILDGGKRLGPSFFAFRNATCVPTQSGPAPICLRWTDREGAEIAVTGLLADITIRHRLEDCTDIPPNHEYPRKFSLAPAHYAQYRKLEETSILAIKDRTVNAVNGAVLYNKLLQIASGAVYDDSGGYSVLDNSRYELVMDLVEERRQSVVFFNWEHQRELLVAGSREAGTSIRRNRRQQPEHACQKRNRPELPKGVLSRPLYPSAIWSARSYAYSS
jgi:hypothetical protein